MHANRFVMVLSLIAGSTVIHATAHAGATLQASSGETLFPAEISVTSEIAAQVESAGYLLRFTQVSAGTYVLTVPAPEGSYPVGVDLDSGQGFAQLPIQKIAPAAGISQTSDTPSQELTDWEGTGALRVRLTQDRDGPLMVRARFVRLLRRFESRVRFATGVARCPLRQANDGATVKISSHVRTFRPMASISAEQGSPQIERPKPNEARISGEFAIDSAEKIIISYTEQGTGINVQLLTHRTPTADPLGGRDGYFLLLIDADELAGPAPPRDLTMVIDRSGSMSGDKMQQAKISAQHMLDQLRPDDRFNIVAFDDYVERWKSASVVADQDDLHSAGSFVDDLYAGGSTDLNAAVLAGIGSGSCSADSAEGRYEAVVLLSDGRATAGVHSSPAIVRNAEGANCREKRIHGFAIGDDADVALLQALSRSSRGLTIALDNQQATIDLAKAVRQLFEDMGAVRLMNLTLQLGNAPLSEVLPQKPHDLFDGGQVVIVGRYHDPTAASIELVGSERGVGYAKVVPLALPEEQPQNSFIKYVWAQEKVGQLLAQEAQGAWRADEITELGMAYQLQTPYTSFNEPPPGSTVGSGGGSSGGGYSAPSSGYDDYGGGALDAFTLSLLALAALGALISRRRRAKPRC